MKTSLEWLRQYAPDLPSAPTAGEALTMAGFPVEQIDRIGEDEVLDVEVTSNRPDLLSHIGVARELAAVLGLPFGLETPQPPEAGEKASDVTSVEIERLDLCPHYAARIVRGIKIGPSPAWMQRRLTAVGLRPINNVVDVTNYVLFETGQPLHAFDFNKLAGRRIVVRTARDGETLRTLDGMDRKLTPDMLCICDAAKPAALAGVMGGEFSEVTGATTDLLLESARFDPLSIRNTSRKLRLMSDSSYRFERGLDPTLAKRAADRACELIRETAGGTLLSGFAEAGSEGYEQKSLTLRFAALDRLLGTQLPRDEVVDALDRLGLSPQATGKDVSCTIPSHRLDLDLEVDLIEEAARIVGYEEIPLREHITVEVRPADVALEAVELIRDTLTAAGYFEAVTFSFVSDRLQKAFLPEGASLRRVDPGVRKADGHLRPSLLPGLCESLRYNETVGNHEAALFEIGNVFYRGGKNPVEERRLAFAGGTSYADCRGILEALLDRLDARRPVKVIPAVRTGFGRDACGQVLWGEEPIGFIGKLDRPAADLLDLRELPAICEVDADALVKGYQPIPQLRPLPRFPAVRRDVSLLVADDLPYDRISTLVEALKLPDVESVEHTSTYRGKPLSKDQKSVTLTLVFRNPDRTLSREDADTAITRLVKAAGEELGAQIRS